MLSSAVREDAAKLAWSLWTELGVSGWRGEHHQWLVDPEPLLLWTAWLGNTDARLRDEVTDWCVKFGDWLSGARITNLSKEFSERTRENFGVLAATVGAHSRTRWKEATAPREYKPTGRSRLEKFSAPSQTSLRLRGVFGVGARAEVMRVLLSRERFSSAGEIADEVGFGRRMVAITLDQLSRANVVEEHSLKNQIQYRLCRGTAWPALVGPMPMVAPQWTRVLPLMTVVHDRLDRIATLPARAARVEAHKLTEQTLERAHAAEVTPPAHPPANEADPLGALAEWSSALLHALSAADQVVLFGQRRAGKTSLLSASSASGRENEE